MKNKDFDKWEDVCDKANEKYSLAALDQYSKGSLHKECLVAEELERACRANMHRGYKEVYGWTDLDLAAAKKLAENFKTTSMTSTEARAYAEKTYGRSKGEKVYTAVLESADEYGLEIVKTGYGNEKIIREKSI